MDKMITFNMEQIRTLKDLQQTRNELNLILEKLNGLEETFKKEEFKRILEGEKSEPIREMEICTLHPVDRDLQDIFINGLNCIGFSSYGDKSLSNGKRIIEFENERFLIRANTYNEDDCNCGYDDIENDQYIDTNNDIGFHGVDCICSRGINFWHKPTNLKIIWYKYALRDAYSNKPITRTYLEALIADCVNNFDKDEVINIEYARS